MKALNVFTTYAFNPKFRQLQTGNY